MMSNRSTAATTFSRLVLILMFLSGAMAVAAEPTTQPAEPKEAAGHLVTELFVGENVYTIEKGEWYLVLTPEFDKAPDEKEFEFEAELQYGLTDRFQLTASVPYAWVDPDGGDQHNGVGDVALSASYNFIQTEDFTLGVRSGFVLPTGDEDRDLGGGQFVWEPSILGAVRAGEGEIYFGVGGEFGDSHVDNAFTYTLAGAYPWKSLVGVLELTGRANNDFDELYLAPGIFWNPSEAVQLGIGVPIGLNDDSDDYRIVGTIIFEF